MVEKHSSATRIHSPASNDKEREEAFENLMNFKRKKVPLDFDYKKELMESIDERFGSVN